MTEPSLTETQFDPYLHYDLRLLHHLSQSLLIAHKANPSSWSLNQISTGTLVLFVEQFWVMSVRADGGDIRFIGASEDFAFTHQSTFKPDFRDEHPIGITVTSLDPDELDMVYRERLSAHHSFVLNRAQAVKTRTQRANEHNPELVELLSHVLDLKLPQPTYVTTTQPPTGSSQGKYRSRTQPVTGYWKQTVDKEQWHDLEARTELVSTLWNEPTEDVSSWPDDRGEFTKLAKQREDYSDGASHRLWMFVKGMKVGDQIIAHASPGKVLGIGTVKSDYQYIDGRHRRSVEWTNTESIAIRKNLVSDATQGQNLWGLTPISQLSFNTIAQEVGLEVDDLENSSPAEYLNELPTAQTLTLRFSSVGLTYTDSQIATFYTALQTKGFVVLSGISGTGKSKIAQGFVEMLPAPTDSSMQWMLDPDQVITREIKPYIPKHHNVVIPTSRKHLFPRMEPDASIYVDTRLLGVTGKARLFNEVMPQGNQVLTLFFRGVLREASSKLIPGEKLYIVPHLDEDGESIESIDLFTESDDIPTHLIFKSTEVEPSNSLFLAVRPDWRDSTSLLGYYNPLTQTYEWTEFLRFLLRAKESFRQKDGLAWFVILDEMNLAHVEYYFADLLSIIESGRDEEGWSREAIRLTYPDTLTDNAPPHEIKLPPNLYIIGTVNMDETTHAFSPKVLDRAFTIELTDVDFTDYPPITAASGPGMPDEDKQALLKAFTRDGIFAQVSKDDIRQSVDDHPEIRLWLQNLNERLAQHQFHFGYRVFDEIAQFIFNADRNGMFDDWTSAFDHAVYMKVLPKFNGSHARLHGPLTALRDWANNPAGPIWVPVSGSEALDEELLPVANGPRMDRVATRAERMLALLEANGFVSFG